MQLIHCATVTNDVAFCAVFCAGVAHACMPGAKNPAAVAAADDDGAVAVVVAAAGAVTAAADGGGLADVGATGPDLEGCIVGCIDIPVTCVADSVLWGAA